MPDAFIDRLYSAVQKKKSVAVVGIDPTPACLPPGLRQRMEEGGQELTAALSEYCLGIIKAVADLVPAVKPNIAFFEAYGLYGLSVYKSVCLAAHSAGLLVIGDVKRGDIGSTAAAYAEGLLDCPFLGFDDVKDDSSHDLQKRLGSLLGPHDALTLNPYLGSDSITPFLNRGLPKGQGFFILVKTSNPSSSEMQDLHLASGGTVAEAAAMLVAKWGKQAMGGCGWSSVGAVVGATHPSEIGRFRKLMPHTPFLLPGYGAQGGKADDVVDAFDRDGSGAVVNASRSILQAWLKEENPGDWIGAARRAALDMNENLSSALRAAGKWNF